MAMVAQTQSQRCVESTLESVGLRNRSVMLHQAINMLDRIRRGFWYWCVRWGWHDRWIRDRSARLTLLASLQIVLAFSLTVFAPLWLLLLGPLILGVPHVISDIRYLLIRPPEKIHRRAIQVIFAALVAMTGLRVYALATNHWIPAWEMVCGNIAVLGAMLWVHKPSRWRWPLLAVSVYLCFLSVRWPQEAILVVGHLHNFIAVGLWLYWSKGEGPWHRYAGVIVLYLLCVAALGFGVFERLSASTGAFSAPASGLHFGELVSFLAPGFSPTWGFRLVLIYAFAQAIHYTVWLRLIPGNHHFYSKPRPSTFRENIQRLRHDFGSVGFVLCIAGCVLVPVLGIFHPTGTRSVYLSLILFHGWLEIAVIAHLLARQKERHS